MAFNLNIRAAKDPGTVDVYLYGNISRWDEVTPSKVAQQIKDLEEKYTKCVIHLNSNGGEVTEGIAIHKILSDTKMSLEIHVDGVAASMAAVLVQVPKAVRIMGKYSKMMLHSPSGYAHGNSEELRNYAQMMDDFETTLVDIIADRCGFDSDDVKKKWFDKKDHWLTAQQALDAKLIDKIVDGLVTKEPKDMTDAVAIYNFYEAEISNQNHIDMDFTKLLAKLGLAANTTEDQAMDFAVNVVAENQTLKTKVTGLEAELLTLRNQAAEARRAEIKNLIDAAVAAKKITEDQRAVYQSLFDKDFDNAKAVLDSIKPYMPLTSVPGAMEGIVGIPEDRKSWTFTDWQKQDGKGLADLKASNKEAYTALYKKSFGKEPQL